MKRVFFFFLALLTLTTASAKVDKQVVVFSVDLHCQGCCDKIMHNIAYEKGVKDLVCDLQTKTVTVTYDANKTSVEALQAAFLKIGKPATLPGEHKCCQGQHKCEHKHEGEHHCDGHHDHGHVDAQSGATTQHK